MDVWIVCNFFAVAGSAAANILACDSWGPPSRVSLGLFLGLKVYTFSTCLDNAKWIFQRDSSFPSDPRPQSLLCSSSGSSRPVGKGLWDRAREKPVSLHCSDPHFRAQEVTTLPEQPGKSPPVAWVGSGSQAPLRAAQTGANSVDPKAKSPVKPKQMSGNNILANPFLFKITKVLIFLWLSESGIKKTLISLLQLTFEFIVLKFRSVLSVVGSQQIWTFIWGIRCLGQQDYSGI